MAAEADAYRSKLAAIAEAQRAGQISTALDPVDLLILVLALASAWLSASPALQSLAGNHYTSAGRLAAHRAAVAVAVRALSLAPTREAAASPR